MSGRSSKQKGPRGEREAAAELGALLGVDARRGVQYQGGPGSPDVVLDGVAILNTSTVRRRGLAHGRPQWQGSGPWRTGAVCAAFRRRSVRG